MTPAQTAGLVIGQKYEVTGGGEHSYKVGSIVEFTIDDGSRQPKFRGAPVDSRDGYADEYIYVTNVKPVEASKPAEFSITFRVTKEATVFAVSRELTKDEVNAVFALLNK